MAHVKTAPKFLERLEASLIDTLNNSGIDAEVEIEPVPTTKLYRVFVLAPKFKVLKHSERQGLVWRIAEQALSQDELMRVSMIVTLTPAEAEGE